MLNTYYFSKIIKCGLCQGSMRAINERGTKKYICSKNSLDSSKCTRNKIEEQLLINHVLKYTELKHIRYELSKDYFRSLIEEVLIFEDSNFIIKYKDGNVGYIKNNGLRYI
jgi:hypothetical protein